MSPSARRDLQLQRENQLKDEVNPDASRDNSKQKPGQFSKGSLGPGEVQIDDFLLSADDSQ